MDFFDRLEFDRLLKELNFIDSDLIYKSSLLKVADENFVNNVNKVLECFPKLKEILDDKNNKRLQIITDETIVVNQLDKQIEIPIKESDVITETKPPKIKNLYRQIARSTHPDVNGRENLKEVYLDAQKAYDSNDLVQILSICDKLKINYEITKEEFDLIRCEIDTKKQRIKFLESTYTWRWYNEHTDEGKNKVILHYLESQISR